MELKPHFNEWKSIIGYVPQEDIIFENLTLRRMLSYTADLKMPSDTSKAEKTKESIRYWEWWNSSSIRTP